MQKTVVIFIALIALSSQQFSLETSFCWRDSVVRGAGTIPDACPAGREKIGLLCYDVCPSGYTRIAFDCYQTCPDGLRDDGLYCRKAEYGRGGGYAWQFGDWFNDDGMRGRC